MLISDERLELALKRLAQTDGAVADLHMEVERCEFLAKATKESVFTRSGGTVAERTAAATTSEDYLAAMENYFAALKAHEKMRNERAREVIVIDVWRSLNSTRNKGLL